MIDVYRFCALPVNDVFLIIFGPLFEVYLFGVKYKTKNFCLFVVYAFGSGFWFALSTISGRDPTKWQSAISTTSPPLPPEASSDSCGGGGEAFGSFCIKSYCFSLLFTYRSLSHTTILCLIIIKGMDFFHKAIHLINWPSIPGSDRIWSLVQGLFLKIDWN